jgi:hypothetical protein
MNLQEINLPTGITIDGVSKPVYVNGFAFIVISHTTNKDRIYRWTVATDGTATWTIAVASGNKITSIAALRNVGLIFTRTGVNGYTKAEVALDGAITETVLENSTTWLIL